MKITGKLQDFYGGWFHYITEEVKPGQIWVHMLPYYDEIHNDAAVLEFIEGEDSEYLAARTDKYISFEQMPESMRQRRDELLASKGGERFIL
jgi:hypothetical protein